MHAADWYRRAPMSLLLAWLVFPLILGALSLGCGFLVERGLRIELPGALVIPIGLAVIVVAAQVATLSDSTAELAMPLVLALAIAGLVLARPWQGLTIDPWAVVAFAAVFAVFAAPVVLSGSATFAGYTRIDDTSRWLAIIDHVMEHGRNLGGLAPSAYQAQLHDYVGTGYPVGAFLPLGVARPLVGQDAAWLFQPYMAFLGGALALSLYALGARLIQVGWQRALLAGIAAQPALLVGYALTGGMKEVASAWIIALAVALLPLVLEREDRRSLIPLTLVTGAVFSIMSFGGVIWILPMLLAAAGVLWFRKGARPALERSGWFALFGLLLVVPALPAAIDFIGSSAPDILTKKGDIGGLVKPLSFFQIFGVWFSGDFRLTPGSAGFTDAFIVVVIAAGIGGLVWAASRRAAEPLIYVGAVLLAVFVTAIPGAPWVDAKAFAIASPAFVFAALVGASALVGIGRIVQAALIAAAIAGGVLWSNVLAYHDVNLAPRDRMVELQDIGKQFAGQGPTFMTVREVYAAYHFLRDTEAVTAGDDKVRRVPLRTGELLGPGRFADIDDFKLDALLSFRTLVVAHSPMTSRPPSAFKLVRAGHYFDVWQRSPRASENIVDHLSLNRVIPINRARCRDVKRLAREAGPKGRLAVAVHRYVTPLQLSSFSHPASWKVAVKTPGLEAFFPFESGTASARTPIPAEGTYDVWLGGGFRRPVTLSVDRRVVGKTGYKILLSGEYTRVASTKWTRGVHQIDVTYGGGSLHPGSGGQPFPLGPLILGVVGGNDNAVTPVPVKQAHDLCGKVLDWIEALRS
jgi:hypothetical protein